MLREGKCKCTTKTITSTAYRVQNLNYGNGPVFTDHKVVFRLFKPLIQVVAFNIEDSLWVPDCFRGVFFESQPLTSDPEGVGLDELSYINKH